MKNSLTSAAAALLVALAAFGVACKSTPPKPEPTPVPAPVSTPTVVTIETPAPVPSPAPGQPELSTSVDAINKAGYLKPVFFDFDKYDIRADQRDTLAGNAAFLQKWPTVQFTIEGHCDERGTREYNLALGDRRASAAKEYLVSLGVSAARIKTVSYGKERPFALGHDEDSWAKNRRGHFVVTAR
jgi:peptidoglycan-associated lipoprotein